jgi:hypothetical protein
MEESPHRAPFRAAIMARKFIPTNAIEPMIWNSRDHVRNAGRAAATGVYRYAELVARTQASTHLRSANRNLYPRCVGQHFATEALRTSCKTQGVSAS